jgi:hypothetical protein
MRIRSPGPGDVDLTARTDTVKREGDHLILLHIEKPAEMNGPL